MRLPMQALCASLLVTLACAAPQRELFEVNMVTKRDDGLALGDVSVYHGETLLGTTTKSATRSVQIEAEAGTGFPIRFVCPEGYSATRDEVQVPLRRTSEVANSTSSEDVSLNSNPSLSSAYALTLECKPSTRKAMLVVLSNMANVPVKLGNEVVGTTDLAGVAHLALEFPAKEVFELRLDTSSNDRLRPVDPHFPFVMTDHDELFVVQEAFKELPLVVGKRKRRPRRAKKKKAPEIVIEKRSRPTLIDGSEKQWGDVKTSKKN